MALLAPLGQGEGGSQPAGSWLPARDQGEAAGLGKWGTLSWSCLQHCRDMRTNKHFKQNAWPRVAPSITLFNDTPDAGIFKSNEQCIKLVLHEVKKKCKWKGAFKSSSISPSNCFSQGFGILLHLWCYSLLIIQALCLQTSVLTHTAEVSTTTFYHRGFPNQPGRLWRGLVSQPMPCHWALSLFINLVTPNIFH